VISILAVASLILPLSDPLLVASGALSGIGSGLVVTTLVIELSRRTDDSDRGSAMSLFSASQGIGLALGSVGAAPVIASAGFALGAGLCVGGMATALGLAVVDAQLRAVAGMPGKDRAGCGESGVGHA
jgi:predicted MFS family arabinose efflux permease